jgi:GNAT superfamily N-acetyltransferase
MSKASEVLQFLLEAEVEYSVEENEDGFTISAMLGGKEVGTITVKQEYVGSGGDGYPFEPYKAEPFYDEITDHDFVIAIDHLKVEPDQRGQGIGKALMDKAMQEIGNAYNGVPVYINASPMGMDITLEKLIQFYQKEGFKLLKAYPQHRNALMWYDPVEGK